MNCHLSNKVSGIGVPWCSGTFRSVRWITACLVLQATAGTGSAFADQFVLYARDVPRVPNSWDFESQAQGAPGNNDCDHNPETYAVNRVGFQSTPLVATRFTRFTLPAGHVVVRVKVDVLARYDFPSTGNIRARVLSDAGNRTINKTFSSSNGNCGWRLGDAGDITDLADWCNNPGLVNTIQVSIQRRTNDRVLRCKAFRIVVTTRRDTTPPDFICPAGISVPCVGQVPAPDPGAIIAIDDRCGPVSVVHVGDGPLQGGPCGGTIARTYRATDARGNAATCVQLITVADNVRPSITCPPSLTVQCLSDVPAPSFSGGATSDNCGPVNLQWVSDSSLSGGPCGGTISRRWRATDQCGNSRECTQIIVVCDTTRPTITCPSPMTVQCPAEVPPPQFTGTASDNCGSPNIVHVRDTTAGDACDRVITRTWRATDSCGNTRTCDQIIRIADTTHPTVTCPLELSVGCLADIPAPDFTNGSATDNCGTEELLIEHTGDSPLQGDACNGTLSRTWRVTDPCGNLTTCQQVINVSDSTAPIITPPPDIVAEPDAGRCDADVDVGSASTSDDCPGPTTLSASRSDGLSIDDPFPIGVTTIEWSSTDACGNVGTAVQEITVVGEDCDGDGTCDAVDPDDDDDGIPDVCDVERCAEGSSVLGDLNCDGAITIADINPFVLALTDPKQYRLLFPNCDPICADVNRDRIVSVSDIRAFVALLQGN